MLKEGSSQKRELGQISEVSGLSRDFLNQVMPICYSLQDAEAGKDEDAIKEKLSDFYAANPIKHYEERYPSHVWENVVNENNREAVAALDIIVDEINQKLSNPTDYSIEDLRKFKIQIESLIN